MATLFGKSSSKRKREQHAPKLSNDTEDDDEDIRLNLIKRKTETTSDPPDSSSNAVDELEAIEDLPSWASFKDLGLVEPLVHTCQQLGFKRPTPVQRMVIPFLLKKSKSHLLALAATGSGKTAAFTLPLIQHLIPDPYGVFAVILTPTRELAKQIHQQVLVLGSAYKVQSSLVVGGLDAVRQSCDLEKRPHFCVATPGRLALLLRGPKPPRLQFARFIVLDEADRLLAAGSGFERDVAELLLHCTTLNGVRRETCQTLLFSATMTRSLESMEEMAGAGLGRLPLKKIVVEEGVRETGKSASAGKTLAPSDANQEKADALGETKESTTDATTTPSPTIPKLPAGLKQEYIFMPSRVRDTYLLTTLRTLMENGGRKSGDGGDAQGSGWNAASAAAARMDDDDDNGNNTKARSAIVFVSTCERAAFVSGILTNVGVDNVAIHSLLSQNRRLASLGKFKSQQVRVLVATDVASRGLDIPTVDLVVNSELPRSAVSYVHRVGRTARAGRRGRAVSLVAECDIGLLHGVERVSGRQLEKCTDVTDEMAIKLLGPVAKAARLTKMKLMDIGFDELVQKTKERKTRDRKERERIERALRRMEKKDAPQSA